MEKASKRNIVLTVIVAILILVIGVSFAYFLAQTLINGEGSTSKVTTAVIKDTTFTVTGELEFNDEGIYPGHKNVSKIKVVAKENAGVTIDYNLIWNGRNGLATPINYYVYKTTSNENPSITCEVQKGMKSGYEIIYEECTNSNFDNLGEIISSGTITTSNETRKIVLKENESIISSDAGTTVYYYVVLEYPNLDTAQNRDSEHTFQGEVTVELYEKTTCGTHNVTTVLGVLEVNDCEPNFALSSEEADTTTGSCKYNGESVIAGPGGTTTEATCQKIYQVAGMGYVDSSLTTMFQKQEGNGVWNSATSTCTYNDNNVSLFPSGSPTEEQCGKEIYLNTDDSTYVAGIEEVGAGTWGEATGKTGIYEAEDGMYGGTSYYYRGAVENNYLKFADYCWRIVRINGDGSIRLIYDGTTCHGNGTETAESTAIANKKYNTNYDRSEYVGYTYVEGKQRPEVGDTEVESNLKIETEKWYQENIVSKGLDNKVATSKFCNDREVAEGSIWSSQPSETFYYAAYIRNLSNKPNLSCTNKNDVYSLKAGAITADEISIAGGNFSENSSYYLYNGQEYWTMSPYNWCYYDSSTRGANVFYVHNNGQLSYSDVYWTTPGVRPVLSLNSNSLTISGSGTITDPYVAS